MYVNYFSIKPDKIHFCTTTITFHRKPEIHSLENENNSTRKHYIYFDKKNN